VQRIPHERILFKPFRGSNRQIKIFERGGETAALENLYQLRNIALESVCLQVHVQRRDIESVCLQVHVQRRDIESVCLQVHVQRRDIESVCIQVHVQRRDQALRCFLDQAPRPTAARKPKSSEGSGTFAVGSSWYSHSALLLVSAKLYL